MSPLLDPSIYSVTATQVPYIYLILDRPYPHIKPIHPSVKSHIHLRLRIIEIARSNIFEPVRLYIG